MTLAVFIFGVLLVAFGANAAKLELSSRGEPVVLAGGEMKNEVRIANPSDAAVETELYLRLFQRSSATIMPVGEARRWKRITVLPHQTVLEEVTAEIPPVRSTSRFELRCSDSRGETIGTVMIAAYPANLLKELNDLAGTAPIGIYDPHQHLGAALTRARVDFVDLQQVTFENFRGRLAVVFANDFEPVQKRASDLIGCRVRTLFIEPAKRESSTVIHERDGARWAHFRIRNDAELKSDAAAQLQLISTIRVLMKTNLCQKELKP